MLVKSNKTNNWINKTSYSIRAGDFGLCSDGKWRHAGFHTIGSFTQMEVDDLMLRWKSKGIDTSNIEIEICA